MLVVYYGATQRTFRSQFSKFFHKKISYSFSQKRPALKKFLIFSQKKAFLISRNGTLHFSAQARKIKKKPTPRKSLTFSHNKAFLIFQETKIPNKFVIFRETKTPPKNFLYFRKWKPPQNFLFQEVTNFPSSKSKKDPLIKCFLYFGK